MKNLWMPLYIGDYLADTQHLSTAQHGAYLLLIMHYWRQGSLPNDDAELARIARMSRHEWAHARRVVRAFFDESMRHTRIDSELSRCAKVSSARKQTGARGGNAKALKYKEVALANATDLPPSLPDVCYSKPPSKPPSKNVDSHSTIPDGIVHSPLPKEGKGSNGKAHAAANSEPVGSGADAPLKIISVPKLVTKVDAARSAYFKRGREILGDRPDTGRLVAAILKNNNGNLNAARLAMERVACAASPLDYANRLANGPPKRDDDEEARRRNGDCF